MTDQSTCDGHVHVFDPDRFAYSPHRRFTPATATAAQLTQYLDRVGLGRVVLVQPSVYGTDNRCLVDALTLLGPRAKGVAVISTTASSEELDSLSAAGVVGARLNLVVHRSDDTAAALHSVQQLDTMLPPTWHIQLHVTLDVLAGMASYVAGSRRLFVLDHLGLPVVANGTKTWQWQQMLALVQTGRLVVKASGPYLSSQERSPYQDLRPFIESLTKAQTTGLVWGSNWPHTQGVHRSAGDDPNQVESFRDEDDHAWLDVCAHWLGADLFDQLHRNAARLYGFDQSSLTPASLTS